MTSAAVNVLVTPPIRNRWFALGWRCPAVATELWLPLDTKTIALVAPPCASWRAAAATRGRPREADPAEAHSKAMAAHAMVTTAMRRALPEGFTGQVSAEFLPGDTGYEAGHQNRAGMR